MGIESCKPFFFEKSEDVGILLIHGFTGSPGEMRPLGEYLAEHGFTVYGILLPGHCTSPEDMNSKKWTDWANAVENGYNELVKKGIKNIFVCGLSMGGVLTLYFGELQKKVSGLIPLSAPVEMKDKRLILLPILKHFKKFMTKKEAYQNSQEIKYELDHFSYEVIPLNALHELVKLIRITRRELSKITAPILIVQSKNDELVDPINAEIIFTNVASTDKRILWLEKSHHVVTLDIERKSMYEEIEKFIREHIS
ncbi:MAG: alpha/beta hydrolase [Candidatus Asgardarchaeia archaeon]